MSTLSKSERQEISLLLPWYANGTLDDEDRRKVEAALVHDEALAREFDLVLEDQTAMVALTSDEEVPISMAERFKAALNAELDKPEAELKPQRTGKTVLGRLISVLFPAQPRAYAFVAATVVLLLPAVAIVSYVAGSQQTNQFHTASGEEETIGDTARLLVKFGSEVTWTEVDAFLKDNQGQIVKGPTADGLYELEFEKNNQVVEKLGVGFGVLEFALPVN